MVDTATSTLVDFLDCIILEAMKIDDRDTGNRIVYNLVHDEVAQRVVEAYYRQKQSVAHVVEALKRYKTPTQP